MISPEKGMRPAIIRSKVVLPEPLSLAANRCLCPMHGRNGKDDTIAVSLVICVEFKHTDISRGREELLQGREKTNSFCKSDG